MSYRMIPITGFWIRGRISAVDMEEIDFEDEIKPLPSYFQRAYAIGYEDECVASGRYGRAIPLDLYGTEDEREALPAGMQYDLVADADLDESVRRHFSQKFDKEWLEISGPAMMRRRFDSYMANWKKKQEEKESKGQ